MALVSNVLLFTGINKILFIAIAFGFVFSVETEFCLCVLTLALLLKTVNRKRVLEFRLKIEQTFCNLSLLVALDYSYDIFEILKQTLLYFQQLIFVATSCCYCFESGFSFP